MLAIQHIQHILSTLPEVKPNDLVRVRISEIQRLEGRVLNHLDIDNIVTELSEALSCAGLAVSASTETDSILIKPKDVGIASLDRGQSTISLIPLDCLGSDTELDPVLKFKQNLVSTLVLVQETFNCAQKPFISWDPDEQCLCLSVFLNKETCVECRDVWFRSEKDIASPQAVVDFIKHLLQVPESLWEGQEKLEFSQVPSLVEKYAGDSNDVMSGSRS